MCEKFESLVFLSTYDLISRLRDKKKLMIENNQENARKIESIGYSLLVMSYRDPFYNLDTKQYNPNTSIDDLVALYTFDEALRAILIRPLLHFENQFKTILSNVISSQIGTNECEYLNNLKYNRNRFKDNEIDKVMKSIRNCIYSKRTIVDRYHNNMKSIPPWAALRVCNLSLAIKWYSILPVSMQINISKNFKRLPEVMHTNLLSLQMARNICVHNLPIYNARFYDQSSKNLKEYQKYNIPYDKEVNTYRKGINDFFSIIYILYNLLPDLMYQEFIKKISFEINQLKHAIAHDSFEKIMELMGINHSYLEEYHEHN